MATHRSTPRGSALAVPLLLAAALPAAGQEVVWRHDYARARAEARATGRPLVIDFGTERCFWCKKLDLTTFRDPAVAALLRQEFITLRIDAGRQPRLAHALQIDRYPTVVFADADGTILGKLVGYSDAARFRAHLESVLDGAPTPEWMARTYQEACAAIAGPDYPRAITLLRKIAADDTRCTARLKSRQLLGEFERLAGDALRRAEQLQAEGRAEEARAVRADVVRTFDGTDAARGAAQALTARAR